MFSNYKSQIVFFFIYSFFLIIISISIVYYLELRMESLYKMEVDEKIYLLQNAFDINLNKNGYIEEDFTEKARKFIGFIDKDIYDQDKIKFIIFNNQEVLFSNDPFLSTKVQILPRLHSAIQEYNGIKFLIKKYASNNDEKKIFFVLLGFSIDNFQAFQNEKWKLIYWTIFTILALIALYFIFVNQLLKPYKIIEKLSVKYSRFLRGNNDIGFLAKVLLYIKDDMDIQNKVMQNLRLDLINEKFIGEIYNVDLTENNFSILIYDYFEGIIFFNEELEKNFDIDGSKIFRKKLKELSTQEFFTNFLNIFHKETLEGVFEYKGKKYYVLKVFNNECSTSFTLIFLEEQKFNHLKNNILEQIRFEQTGKLASNILHEYKNSIATIKGYLELIKKKKFSEIYLNNIAKEIEFMENISNEFRKITNKISLDLSEFLLEDLIYDIMEDFSYNYDFELIINNNGVESIVGDINLLSIVLKNIIANSLESIKETGITGEIKISLENEEKNISITLLDNGIGIDKEEFDNVFDVFYTTKSTGTGLGLSYAKKIISAHRGEIFFEEVDQGAKLVILLPKSEVK